MAYVLVTLERRRLCKHTVLLTETVTVTSERCPPQPALGTPARRAATHQVSGDGGGDECVRPTDQGPAEQQHGCGDGDHRALVGGAPASANPGGHPGVTVPGPSPGQAGAGKAAHGPGAGTCRASARRHLVSPATLCKDAGCLDLRLSLRAAAADTLRGPRTLGSQVQMWPGGVSAPHRPCRLWPRPHLERKGALSAPRVADGSSAPRDLSQAQGWDSHVAVCTCSFPDRPLGPLSPVTLWAHDSLYRKFWTEGPQETPGPPHHQAPAFWVTSSRITQSLHPFDPPC